MNLIDVFTEIKKRWKFEEKEVLSLTLQGQGKGDSYYLLRFSIPVWEDNPGGWRNRYSTSSRCIHFWEKGTEARWGFASGKGQTLTQEGLDRMLNLLTEFGRDTFPKLEAGYFRRWVQDGDEKAKNRMQVKAVLKHTDRRR